MKYIAHLLTDEEYRQKTIEYTRKHFIKKNKHLLDLHQRNIATASKDFPNVWSKELKETLWKKQGMRCCICEVDFLLTHSTDIEHYRPKNEYWWLAYDYNNYYLACSECNRKYKETQFPLFDESTRVNYLSRKNIKQELPLLINPFFDEPLDYFKIHFRTASNSKKNIIVLMPKEKASNSYNYLKAKTSIDTYNLDLSEYFFTRHEIFRKFFNKLIKVAVHREVLKHRPKQFAKFYKEYISQDDRRELHSLGLMKMVRTKQFIIDPIILNNYRRKYNI